MDVRSTGIESSWRGRSLVALAALLLACSPGREPGSGPLVADARDDDPESVLRTGIEGCNCAGAAPVMMAPDGIAYPFPSVIAYYYKVLQAYWSSIAGELVLSTWLPPSIEQTSEAFYAWQAKSVQIYRDRGVLGFAHRYYRGIFGFLEASAGGGGEGGGGGSGSGSGSGSGGGSGDTGSGCTPALDPWSRLIGLLAHVGLSQAGVCGTNDDGTTKFWQVNNIALLTIGEVVDASALISSGLARAVDVAPADRCILPQSGAAALPVAASTSTAPGTSPMIPCRIAFRDDAVTEAVVLPVPSPAVVAGVPLEHRAFTAAGATPMPNGLAEARRILRDADLRAMFAVGVPRFVPEPFAGPSQVRLVSHAIGPAISPSSVLLPDERGWVDGMVGLYDERCCRIECTAGAAAAPAARDQVFLLDAGFSRDASLPLEAGFDAGVRDASLPDAGFSRDASLPDAGFSRDASLPPPDAGFDAGVRDALLPPPDAGWYDGGTPDAGGPECRRVCEPEGTCQTGAAGAGLVVMVSSATTKECFGSCPEPATGVPASGPICGP
jgi:hypothetical protein